MATTDNSPVIQRRLAADIISICNRVGISELTGMTTATGQCSLNFVVTDTDSTQKPITVTTYNVAVTVACTLAS